jgi:hypothetical protein
VFQIFPKQALTWMEREKLEPEMIMRGLKEDFLNSKISKEM